MVLRPVYSRGNVRLKYLHPMTIRFPIRHQICQHILCRAIVDVDGALIDVVSDKMELDVDMFRFRMVCWLIGE
jgi:hypothetical protein